MEFPKEKLLKYPLSDEEKQVMGEILAKKLEELKKVKWNAKDVAKEYRKKIQELEDEIFRQSKILDDGQDFKKVSVDYISDMKAGVIRTIRKDTGEIVEERPATQAERDALFSLWPDEIEIQEE